MITTVRELPAEAISNDVGTRNAAPRFLGTVSPRGENIAWRVKTIAADSVGLCLSAGGLQRKLERRSSARATLSGPYDPAARREAANTRRRARRTRLSLVEPHVERTTSDASNHATDAPRPRRRDCRRGRGAFGTGDPRRLTGAARTPENNLRLVSALRAEPGPPITVG